MIATDDNVPFAEMPPWLAEMLREPAGCPHGKAVMPENWRKLVREGVTEGRRNDAIARLAGKLLRPGPKDPFVVLDLIRCWNECRCVPPLADQELLRTVESIAGRELARGGANA